MEVMIAVVLAVVGAVVVAMRRANARSSASLLDESDELPPLVLTPIGSAPREGCAAFAGHVRTWEGERDVRGVDDRPVVWLEVLVESGTIDPDTHQVVSYTPVLFFVDAVPFALDDGTGRARVVPSGGRLAQGASSRPRRRAEGDALRWIHDLLVAQNKAVDVRTPLFFAAAAISPGERVSVRATITREGAPEGYRTSAQAVVTLRAAAEPLLIARLLG